MDPFALLGAPRHFDLDLGALEKTHRELSRALHPDKFAQAGASERRSALERAADVNEAWRIVRDPIRRAEALFRLAGAIVGEATEPKASPAFLMEVMDDREALAEARAKRDLAKVKKLGGAMRARAKEVEGKLSRLFDDHGTHVDRDPRDPRGDILSSLPLLGELRFYARFLEEVSAIVDEAEERELSS
jgi:molecular chaperone HscB